MEFIQNSIILKFEENNKIIVQTLCFFETLKSAITVNFRLQYNANICNAEIELQMCFHS